jgi:hypothetical protein
VACDLFTSVTVTFQIRYLFAVDRNTPRVACERENAHSKPNANPYFGRVIGTIRRGCLDHLIPLNARDVKAHRLGPPDSSAPFITNMASRSMLASLIRVGARDR